LPITPKRTTGYATDPSSWRERHRAEISRRALHQDNCACAASGPDSDPSDPGGAERLLPSLIESRALVITVEGERDLTVALICSSDAHAEVRGTTDEVRVENVSGEAVSSDCQGIVTLTLEQPLGTRTLVVEGDVWHDVGRDCPFGDFGPGDEYTCGLP
jgi:hypothetical protein